MQTEVPHLVGGEQGTLNLLAAAQQAGVKKIVLISSIGADNIFFPLNLFFGVSGPLEMLILGCSACILF